MSQFIRNITRALLNIQQLSVNSTMSSWWGNKDNDIIAAVSDHLSMKDLPQTIAYIKQQQSKAKWDKLKILLLELKMLAIRCQSQQLFQTAILQFNLLTLSEWEQKQEEYFEKLELKHRNIIESLIKNLFHGKKQQVFIPKQAIEQLADVVQNIIKQIKMDEQLVNKQNLFKIISKLSQDSLSLFFITFSKFTDKPVKRITKSDVEIICYKKLKAINILIKNNQVQQEEKMNNEIDYRESEDILKNIAQFINNKKQLLDLTSNLIKQFVKQIKDVIILKGDQDQELFSVIIEGDQDLKLQLQRLFEKLRKYIFDESKKEYAQKCIDLTTDIEQKDKLIIELKDELNMKEKQFLFITNQVTRIIKYANIMPEGIEIKEQQQSIRPLEDISQRKEIGQFLIKCGILQKIILENENNKGIIENLNNEVTQLRQNGREIAKINKEQKQKLEAKNMSLNDQNQRLQQIIQSQKNIIEKYKTNQLSFKSINEDLTKQKNTLKDNLLENNKKLQQLTLQHQQLKNEYSLRLTQLDKLKNQINQKNQKITNQQGQINLKITQISQIRENLNQQKIENGKLQNQINQMKRKINQIKEELDQEKSKNLNLQNQIKELNQKINQIEEELEKQKSKNIELQNQIKELNQKINQSQLNLKNQKGKNIELQNQKIQMNRYVGQLKEDLFITQQKLTKLNRDFSKYFPNEILQQRYNSKKYLVGLLQKNFGVVDYTRLVFRHDPLNIINFHKYIDNIPNILTIVQLCNGKIIVGFSDMPFTVGCRGNKAMLASLTTQDVFFLKQGARGITYDEFYIIYGNSELRLKSNDPKIFSNFGIGGAYFQNKKSTIDTIFGAGKTNELPIISFEIYQVIFDN